jgi:hypothetical protein
MGKNLGDEDDGGDLDHISDITSNKQIDQLVNYSII